MNIALIGYGKMGQAIEEIAESRGHEIVLKISSINRYDITKANLQQVDVAIEFTKPEAALKNILDCLKEGVNVVCGTTGWNNELPKAKIAANEYNAGFLHASNFSIGVNVFFELNKYLAAMMDNLPDYNIMLEETHHLQKKDAPSGTAITLAEQIIQNITRKRHWSKEPTDEPSSFPIIAHRKEGVPGTHSIKYTSDIDDIEIIHTAHNRKGFALGAVLAAEFMHNKKGVFSMKDVLGMG